MGAAADDLHQKHDATDDLDEFGVIAGHCTDTDVVFQGTAGPE